MRRAVITLVAIAALSLTASGKGDGSSLRCTITGKIVKSCCCETAANRPTALRAGEQGYKEVLLRAGQVKLKSGAKFSSSFESKVPSFRVTTSADGCAVCQE